MKMPTHGTRFAAMPAWREMASPMRPMMYGMRMAPQVAVLRRVPMEAGLGISIMPQLLLRHCNAHVKIYPIEPEEYRVVGLAVQRPTAMAPAVEQMFRHIVEFCQQMEH